MGCYNSWANLGCSGCSPLEEKLLWKRTIISFRHNATMCRTEWFWLRTLPSQPTLLLPLVNCKRFSEKVTRRAVYTTGALHGNCFDITNAPANTKHMAYQYTNPSGWEAYFLSWNYINISTTGRKAVTEFEQKGDHDHGFKWSVKILTSQKYLKLSGNKMSGNKMSPKSRTLPYCWPSKVYGCIYASVT